VARGGNGEDGTMMRERDEARLGRGEQVCCLFEIRVFIEN